eukprot:2109966-Heterocapsa_arctica.AAC.1
MMRRGRCAGLLDNVRSTGKVCPSLWPPGGRQAGLVEECSRPHQQLSEKILDASVGRAAIRGA